VVKKNHPQITVIEKAKTLSNKDPVFPVQLICAICGSLV